LSHSSYLKALLQPSGAAPDMVRGCPPYVITAASMALTYLLEQQTATEKATGRAAAWEVLHSPLVPQQPLLSLQPQPQLQQQQPGQQHQGLASTHHQQMATRFPDQASAQDVLRGISLRDPSLFSPATSAALHQRLAQAEARPELLQQVLEDLRAEQGVQLQQVQQQQLKLKPKQEPEHDQ
jgi:hypothetical protein